MPKKPRKTAAPEGPWQAREIVLWDIARLVPNARNARLHSDEQIDQLARSIEKFGFTIPVMADAETGELIAGHGRILAAQKLGFTQVPVIVAPAHWTEDDRRAYGIADNKLALNSSWDPVLLEQELSALAKSGFDLNLVGFDGDELARILDDADQSRFAGVAGSDLGDGSQGEDAGDGAGEGGDTEQVPTFSTPISHDALVDLRSAIKRAKATYGVATTGEALGIIAREWLARPASAPLTPPAGEEG